MTNDILNRLIATGKAQFGTYISTGALSVLEVPKGKGVIITHMRLRAFADLPAGFNFTSRRLEVSRFSWHQLRVIGDGAINAFQARHQLTTVQNNAGVIANIPVGFTDWDVQLNHEGSVIFELSHAGNWPAAGVAVFNPLPSSVKVPKNPEPPFGYGRAGFGGIPALETMTTAAIPGWTVRPFNVYTAPNPINSDSKVQFIWPIVAGVTALNPPLFAIEFGELTIPILEVKYVLFNKQPDWTFSKPI